MPDTSPPALPSPPARCTAFEGDRRIATGDLREVALKVKVLSERGGRGTILVFDDETARPIELDLRGSSAEVLARLPAWPAPDPASGEPEPQGPPAAPPRGPGRPRLGVVAREVTLLPRHWAWLASQPGGASVTLRKLVEAARRAGAGQDRVRRAQEAAYRFMTALAGDQPGYEEAIRALFAGLRARFELLLRGWPADVAEHARRLAAPAFPVEGAARGPRPGGT
jgi:hypothetical protein